MAANRDKPDRWKSDIALSVDLYNEWFMEFAPKAFRAARNDTSGRVAEALNATVDLRDLSSDSLTAHPASLKTLRLATAPPLAADRLSGLAGVPQNMVKRMEGQNSLPKRMPADILDANLAKLVTVLR